MRIFETLESGELNYKKKWKLRNTLSVELEIFENLRISETLEYLKLWIQNCGIITRSLKIKTENQNYGTLSLELNFVVKLENSLKIRIKEIWIQNCGIFIQA